MGFLKDLFHRKESPCAPIPTPSLELVLLPEPWQGNLPCVHGPNDGCQSHNPSNASIPFDASLFFDNESLKPTTPKPSASHRQSSIPGLPASESPQQITSLLSKDLTLGTLSSLPKIHKSFPYTLSFYHVHSVLSHPSLLSSTNQDTVAILQPLACASTNGSNPQLYWSTTPLLTSTSSSSSSFSSDPQGLGLSLRISLSFALQADLGTWSPSATHARAVSKSGLIGSGYRFAPCLHTSLKFTSHKGEGKDHVRSAGVNYTVTTDDDAKEEKHEWRSDSEGNPETIMIKGCGKCWTDFEVGIEKVLTNDEWDGRVVVCVRVYKDCGGGKSTGDQKWVSLTRKGGEVVRGEEEKGSVRRVFEGVPES
ncbi:hypothetical protein QBC43DRAFT_293215 [Cladorrhinum sp. PSN259]|nr:hypothetical protein QBC43DRAFT_293215 [Cladorrhinum sp. PSN259]